MLKNVSDVILVTKNILFLKILNFVQSFVECKVSLADGMVRVDVKNVVSRTATKIRQINQGVNYSLML
jgi:ribosome-associated protein YbcJ (S4-like RNA binding protein)